MGLNKRSWRDRDTLNFPLTRSPLTLLVKCWGVLVADSLIATPLRLLKATPHPWPPPPSRLRRSDGRLHRHGHQNGQHQGDGREALAGKDFRACYSMRTAIEGWPGLEPVPPACRWPLPVLQSLGGPGTARILPRNKFRRGALGVPMGAF